MLNDAVKSSVVSDRELDQEKSPDPSGPESVAPMRLVAAQGRPLVLQLRA
jgi:hypothetical protein